MFSQIHGRFVDDWKGRKNHNGGTVTFFSRVSKGIVADKKMMNILMVKQFVIMI